MKLAIVILATLVVVLAKQTYDKEKFKKLDVSAITNDSAKLKAFLDCINDKKMCDDLLVNYRDDFLDMVDTACAKCTSSMKTQVGRLFTAATLQYPGQVAALTVKIDPTGSKVPGLLLAIALP